MNKTQTKIMTSIKASGSYWFNYRPCLYGNRTMSAAEKLRDAGLIQFSKRFHTDSNDVRTFECLPTTTQTKGK